MPDFFQQYFIDPIVTGSGYNIYNTIVYGAVLIIAAYLVIKLLKKLKIRMDSKLFYDLLPYVLLGGVLRASEDAHLFSNLGDIHYVFITPLIYFAVFAVTITILAASKISKRDFTREAGAFLITFFTLNIFAHAKNWPDFLLILGATGLIFLGVYYAARKLKPKLMNGINYLPLLAHVTDATASVIAVGYVGGYTEQHVLPGLIFNFLPIWFFIPIKIAVVLLVLHVLDKELGEKRYADLNWMLKFTVFVIGMGPGTRNALTVLLGTNM